MQQTYRGATVAPAAPMASVDPRVFDPTQTTTYKSRTVTRDGETVEKSETTTTTTSPTEGATTYTGTVTRTNQ